MENIAMSGVKRVSLEATVIRADGSVEHLGEVAVWHRNPLARAWNNIKQAFSGKRSGTIRKG